MSIIEALVIKKTIVNNVLDKPRVDCFEVLLLPCVDVSFPWLLLSAANSLFFTELISRRGHCMFHKKLSTHNFMHVKQCDHKISFRSTENPKYFDLYLLLGCRTDTNEHCLWWLTQTKWIYSHFQGKRNPSLSNLSLIPEKLGKPRQKKTQKLIFWGLSQKKIMQHLIFNPHHLSFFCLNCQVVQNISAENENKGETTHKHTHIW